MAHPLEAIIRDAYAAFGRGDVDGYFDEPADRLRLAAFKAAWVGRARREADYWCLGFSRGLSEHPTASPKKMGSRRSQSSYSSGVVWHQRCDCERKLTQNYFDGRTHLRF
jgi:hypothetical protein